MAEDISHPHAARSAQNADFLLDEDTVAPVDCPALSEGLLAELTRYFSLCDAVDDVARTRDGLNAIFNADYAAIRRHEQATNVDMHTINLDTPAALNDHVEWLRLNNMLQRTFPDIYRLTSEVIAREEDLIVIERDIRARFAADLVEVAGAEMVVRFEDVTRTLRINRDALLARCRAILAVAAAAPASS